MSVYARLPVNREQRRRQRRLRVGGLAGASLFATTGLFAGYVGNPRLPRAYALPPGVCGGLVIDQASLDAAILAFTNDQDLCTTISIGADFALVDNAHEIVDGYADQNLSIISSDPSTVRTIDANGFRPFLIDTENPVAITFSNLTVTGATAATSGAAIRSNNAQLTIDDCEFNGNGTARSGGAIYAYGAGFAVGVSVTDSSFDDNSADTSGGAIAVYSRTHEASLSIDGSSTFTNNTGGIGGAVSVLTSTVAASTTIDGDATFSSNHSDSWGGAVYTGSYDGTATTTLTGGAAAAPTFASNSSIVPGGAVATYSRNNGATTTVDGPASFTSNSSGTKGGAIYSSSYESDARTTVTGTDGADPATFTRNTAGAVGGAIFTIAPGTARVDVTDGLLTGNTAYMGGGAIYTGNAHLTRTTFDGNSTTAPDLTMGGAVAVNSAYVSYSTFVNNSSGQLARSRNYGGALFVALHGTVRNSTFTGNAAYTGGGIYQDGDLNLYFSTLSGNTSHAGAGANIHQSALAHTTASGNVLSNPIGGTNCKTVFATSLDNVSGNATGDDTSCGAAADGSISLATDASIALGALSATGDPGRRVMAPAGNSVLNDAVSNTLVGSVTMDQTGALRNFASGKTSIGAVQVAGSGGGGGGDAPAPTPSSSPTLPSLGGNLPGGELPPGTCGATVAGATIPCGQRPAAGGGVDFTGTGWQLGLRGLNAQGGSEPLTRRNWLQVIQGNRLRFWGSGYRPNAPIEVWLFSAGLYLGTATTDASGAFDATVIMPAWVVPGDHTAQVNGYTTSNEVRSVSTGVVVLPAAGTFHQSSKLLGFKRDTTRLTRLGKARAVRVAHSVPAGATQVRIRVVAYPSASTPEGRAAAKKEAATAAKALRKSGLKGRYALHSNGNTTKWPKRAGKTYVTVAYVSYVAN